MAFRGLLTLFILQSLASFALAFNTHFEPPKTLPVLQGKLVYHAYKSYGDGTSQLYLYDFSKHQLKQLSQKSWNITDPMNADISSDGSSIVFMGVQNGEWNVFFWKLNSSDLPINLTKSMGASHTVDEDPKFSLDGKSVIFKRNGEIHVFDISSELKSKPLLAFEEKVLSMPFLSVDSSLLYFSLISAKESGIYVQDLKTNQTTSIDTTVGGHAYYPIVRKDDTLFYVRHLDRSQSLDQIYMKQPGHPSEAVKFNDKAADNSDPTPVGQRYLIYSNTSTSQKYELVLGDLITGRRWSLTPLGVNLSKDVSKLGSRYWRNEHE